MKFFDGPFFIKFSEDYGIRWYGLLITIGVILGLYLVIREFKRRNYSIDDALDMAIYVVVSGFIGARLYYVIWEWNSYKDNPITALYIWNGGLAIYGGVIAGAIALFIYAKIKKYKITTLMDMAAPSLVLAQAIGRWGNFFNKEAFGMPVDNPSLQFFPYAVQIPYINRPKEYLASDWFQATFFYESMACLIIFAIIFLYRKRQKFSGELVLIYLFLYGIERSIVEGFRTDSLYIFNTGIRVSQALSIFLVIFSAGLLAWNYYRVYKNKRNVPETEEISDTKEEDSEIMEEL